MIDLEVVGIRFELGEQAPVLLLKEANGPRHVAMWIGPGEAMSIGAVLAGEQPIRPGTHDLFAALLDELNVSDLSGRIVGVHDGVFFAELEFDGHVLSARPSDVVALAVRRELPLMCTDEVMDEVGVELFSDTDEEISEFQAFLENLEPEDFHE